jgi:hypothetical protein
MWLLIVGLDKIFELIIGVSSEGNIRKSLVDVTAAAVVGDRNGVLFPGFGEGGEDRKDKLDSFRVNFEKLEVDGVGEGSLS